MYTDNSETSSAFTLLNEQIQRWIWQKNWTVLRDIQEEAIPLILSQNTDLIISAATASGKTEAAFLPILTKMLQNRSKIIISETAPVENKMGIAIYISPLIALINDQFERLTELAESLNIPVCPWYGGINKAVKNRFVKNQEGILLITPESLEAFFCTNGFAAPEVFKNVQYIVLDEIHSYIGSERGKQVQSLLHLIDIAAKRRIVRIGLSATLGEPELAEKYLSFDGYPCKTITSSASSNGIRMILKTYCDKPPTETAMPEDYPEHPHLPDYVDPQNINSSTSQSFGTTAMKRISEDIFNYVNSSKSLIFPNTKNQAETYTYLLNKLCSNNHLPPQFHTHHGNISKLIREETEHALKQTSQTGGYSVVCTNTLELGIDIGSVKSVIQIEPPFSVSSLRQRVGRSGRREGETPILRAYTIENGINPQSTVLVQLRQKTVTLAAMIELMLEKWCEPPETGALHLSTLVQQILALICQHGGISVQNAYDILCRTGPFNNVSAQNFTLLLREMGKKKLIEQDSMRTLLCGEKGEKIVNHFSFYAAFASPDEYRILNDSTVIGTLPVKNVIQENDCIIFAGKTWIIKKIEEEARIITVKPCKSGRAPHFYAPNGVIHTKVRQRMKQIFESTEDPRYMDKSAIDALKEARKNYKLLGLDKNSIVQSGSSVLLFPWLGDYGTTALVALFNKMELRAFQEDCLIEFPNGTSIKQVEQAIQQIRKEYSDTLPDPATLLGGSKNLMKQKYDFALGPKLLAESFASSCMNIKEGIDWIKKTGTV